METFRYALLAYMPAPIVAILYKFALPDPVFVISMAMLIVFDTILGIVIAWRGRIFSSSALSKTVIKFIVYAVALQTTHILTMLLAHAGHEQFSAYLALADSGLYLYFAFRETISIAENMGKLGYNMFPPWVMSRLRDFTETGQFRAGAGAGLPEPPPPPEAPAIQPEPPARWGS